MTKLRKLETAFLLLLALTLGAAGSYWFDEVYGWLSSAGSLALRAGGTFAWKAPVRFVRRRILRTLYRVFVPSFIKHLLHRARGAATRRVNQWMAPIKILWRNYWTARACILLPLIVSSLVIAHHLDGIYEFLALTPIPFLATPLFPAGFWILTGAFLMRRLEAIGLDGIARRLIAYIPEDLRDQYEAREAQVLRMIAERRRPYMQGLQRRWHRYRDRHIKKVRV